MRTLFVYGTLREGHGNHRFFLSDSKKIGDGTINAERRGPITVVETDDEDKEVKGEVYQVTEDTLEEIDGLEGYRPEVPNKEQGGYIRKETTVTLDSGEEILAEYYPVSTRTTSRLRG